MVEIHKPRMIKLGTINPAAYNPRRITAAKFEALKSSIRDNGFVHPLVVQKSGMNLIGGHQRRRALIDIEGEKVALAMSVPCIVLDIDDAKAKLLNIALNNTEGEFDPDLLARVINSVVHEVPLGAQAWKATGLSAREIENLVGAPKVPGEGDEGGRPFAASVTLSIAFDSVAERDACKGLIAERSAKSGKKSGTIVRELLEGSRSRPSKRT